MVTKKTDINENLVKTSEKILPLDQIKDDFMLAQSKKQRQIIFNSDTIRIDQLHSKKQVSKDCARAVHFQARDQDGEIHNVGNAACRNKSATIHELLMAKICEKVLLIDECGAGALDDVVLILTDFEPKFASILADCINKHKTKRAL